MTIQSSPPLPVDPAAPPVDSAGSSVKPVESSTPASEPPRAAELLERSRKDSQRLIVVSVTITVIALVGLLYPVPRALSNPMGRSLADLMHVPIFVILTSLALALVSRFISTRLSVHIAITGLVIVASAAVEVVQSKLGRNASLHDLVSNSVGAISSLLIRYSFDADTIFKRACRVLAVAMLLAAVSGPCLIILDCVNLKRSKGALAAFATQTEFHRWYVRHATAVRVDNPFDKELYTANSKRSKTAALIKLKPGDYPMFQLQQLQNDWHEYQELRFNLGRPDGEGSSDDPITIQMRIRDWPVPGERSHSFFKRFTLKPGKQIEVRLRLEEMGRKAATGPLNLKNIRFVEFMMIDLRHPTSFLLADLRLSR